MNLSLRISVLFFTFFLLFPDRCPRTSTPPPLLASLCTSTPNFEWQRRKENGRGWPTQQPQVFFWQGRTYKIRRGDLSGKPEQKIVTSKVFLGQARLMFCNCGIYWAVATSSLLKENWRIFFGSFTFCKSIHSKPLSARRLEGQLALAQLIPKCYVNICGRLFVPLLILSPMW